MSEIIKCLMHDSTLNTNNNKRVNQSQLICAAVYRLQDTSVGLHHG